MERRRQVGIYLLLGSGGVALLAAALPVLIAAGRPSRADVLAAYLLFGGVLLLAAGFLSLQAPQPVATVALSVLGLLLLTWGAMGALVVPNFIRFYGPGGAPFSQHELVGYAALGWTAIAALAVGLTGFWIFYRATRRSGR